MRLDVMLHLPPLDTDLFDSRRLRCFVRQQLLRLVEGGAESVIVENNFDRDLSLPLAPLGLALVHAALEECRKEYPGLQLGLCLRWSKPQRALELAEEYALEMIRLPVFATSVVSRHGHCYPACPELAERVRRLVSNRTDVLADVLVKHSTPLRRTTFSRAGDATIRLGASGLVLASRRAARIPGRDLIRRVARVAAGSPSPVEVVIGGHATVRSIPTLPAVVGRVIVGRAARVVDSSIPPWEWPICSARVSALRSAVEDHARRAQEPC